MNENDTNAVTTPQHSAYGFHCGDCDKFVYFGYDTKTKKLPTKNAVCVNCGGKYEDNQVKKGE